MNLKCEPTFARVGLPGIQELRLPSSFLLHASRPLLISGNLPFGSNRLAPRRAMKTSEVPLPNTDKRMEDEKKPPNPCPMPVHAPQCPGSPSSVLIFAITCRNRLDPSHLFPRTQTQLVLGYRTLAWLSSWTKKRPPSRTASDVHCTMLSSLDAVQRIREASSKSALEFGRTTTVEYDPMSHGCIVGHPIERVDLLIKSSS